jgi:hypothetical protein
VVSEVIKKSWVYSTYRSRKLTRKYCLFVLFVVVFQLLTNKQFASNFCMDVCAKNISTMASYLQFVAEKLTAW